MSGIRDPVLTHGVFKRDKVPLELKILGAGVLRSCFEHEEDC